MVSSSGAIKTSHNVHKTPDISIVVPAFNEEGNIDRLYTELLKVLSSVALPWELVYVDDGSSDGTWGRIRALHDKDERVKAVRFSRNFGHQYALIAGLQHARGSAVISMDGDLQHPPEMIPTLIDEWRKGSKIVKTVRADPEDYSIFKKVSSRWFYRMFSYLSGVRLESGMADFRLLDRKALNDILKFREEGLFLRGIVEWVGYPSISIPYQCANRYSGTTKYTFRKMLKFGWRGVSSFSIVPLRIGVLIGFAASGLSFLGVLYAIFGKLIEGHAVPGWASSVAILSFLFGVLFVLLGLLGEYLGRVLLEVRQRPRFLISEHLGINDSLDQATSSADSMRSVN